MKPPRQGEIWMMNFDPVVGHEQAGRRPALVISDDRMNGGRSRMVIVAPVTTISRNVGSRILINPPEGGLREPSYVICEQVRSISVERLIARWGHVEIGTVRQVVAIVNRLLTVEPTRYLPGVGD